MSANKKPDKGEQENQKLDVILFQHRWRCFFEWDVKYTHEERVRKLLARKSWKTDSDLLSKVNKANAAGTVETIEE